MLSKFSEAIRLLWDHLVLLSCIVLTVWLPGNLLANYLAFHVFGEDDIAQFVRMNMLIEGLFGPLYIGGMMYALSELKQGHQPTYFESISVGFRNWARLFLTRLIAGLLILLGLVALIIPGIILMIRYALIDPAVVLEQADTTAGRKRSVDLTVGIRWQILGAGLLFFVFYLPLVFLVYLPLSLFPALDTMSTNIVLDCFLDVAFAVIQIVMFLYYWQKTQQEREKIEAGATIQP